MGRGDRFVKGHRVTEVILLSFIFNGKIPEKNESLLNVLKHTLEEIYGNDKKMD